MAKKKNKEDLQQPKDKEKALEIAMDALSKKFGEGIIIRGSSGFPHIDRIKSGSIALDRALYGGYARGRIVEISGAESAGKTTLALHAVAECQKEGGSCAFIDMEHALDLEYAANLGVDIEKLITSQPDNAEQALNIAETLIRSGTVDLIIVDSVSALTPRAELEGDIGDSSIGLQARLMSQAMRMLNGIASKQNVTVIFINQIRMKIGIMFGNPEVGSGGNALKYYASQRLDVRRTKTLSEGDDKTGIRSRVKVVKSKVGPPFRAVEVNIMFGKGIDWAADLLDMGVSMGFIDKAGAWYSYNKERIGQGAANAASTLRNSKEMNEELYNKIMKPPEES